MSLSIDLRENTVLYRLYGLNEDTIDSVNDYISKCYSYLAEDICHHIWHIQSFHLSPRIDHSFGSRGVNHFLEGMTNFGENIDDEWLIVYLLFRLTRFDPNLVIRVEDSDGDFLLIEAANDLPEWCQPSNCLNRVFIYREAVHIIPIKCKSFERGMIPSLSEAIDYIRDNPDITRSEEKIQKWIRKRIDCFPERIPEYQHKSHCYVPTGVAALLKHKPSLISLAVNAFYNRTPDDLKACQVMKYFPPESRVMRCITFTRCLYSQLMSQTYTPDVRVGWNLPPNNSRDFKSHDLGMKIASGFEILISISTKFSSNNENNSMKIDLWSDRRWIAFFNSLIKNGYFGEELNGSDKYKQMLRSAENYFNDLIENNDNSSQTDFDSNETKGSKILQILQSLEIDEKYLDENEDKNLEKEDSDEWLDMNSDQLDALLSEKFCSTKQSNNCSDFSTQIPSTLKAFVSNSKSGLKGAEAPKPAKPKRPQRIQFNEDSFADALSSVLSLKVPQSDSDSSSSGMSDYDSDGEESIDSDDDCYHFNESDMNGTKEEVQEIKAYMKAMDQQLAETAVGQSFERTDSPINECNGHQTNEEYKAVDIDLNALKNILESYGSEAGVAGPATALFATMGVKLPDNIDDQ